MRRVSTPFVNIPLKEATAMTPLMKLHPENFFETRAVVSKLGVYATVLPYRIRGPVLIESSLDRKAILGHTRSNSCPAFQRRSNSCPAFQRMISPKDSSLKEISISAAWFVQDTQIAWLHRTWSQNEHRWTMASLFEQSRRWDGTAALAEVVHVWQTSFEVGMPEMKEGLEKFHLVPFRFIVENAEDFSNKWTALDKWVPDSWSIWRFWRLQRWPPGFWLFYFWASDSMSHIRTQNADVRVSDELGQCPMLWLKCLSQATENLGCFFAIWNQLVVPSRADQCDAKPSKAKTCALDSAFCVMPWCQTTHLFLTSHCRVCVSHSLILCHWSFSPRLASALEYKRIAANSIR